MNSHKLYGSLEKELNHSFITSTLFSIEMIRSSSMRKGLIVLISTLNTVINNYYQCASSQSPLSLSRLQFDSDSVAPDHSKLQSQTSDNEIEWETTLITFFFSSLPFSIIRSVDNSFSFSSII